MRRAVARLALGLLIVLTPAQALAAAAGVAFRSGSLGDALAAAKAQHRKLLVDVYATWCGPCHRLDAQVFARASVAGALAADWVALRVDGESAQGRDLAARYHVVGYPTVLFLDAAGTEIDRLFGDASAEEFVKDAASWAKGDGTPARAEEAYFQAHLFDAAAAADLAERFAVKGDLGRARFYRDEVERIGRTLAGPAGPGDVRTARPDDGFRAEGEKRRQGAMEAARLEALAKLRQTDLAVAKYGLLRGRKDFAAARLALSTLADGSPGTPEGREAQLLLAAAWHGLGQNAEAKRALDAWLGSQPANAHAFNAYAWFCFQQRLFLDDGLRVARLGLVLSPTDDGLWDTLAELQFATGRAPDAVESERQALAAGPAEADHYKSQIEKFSKKK